MIDIIGKKNIYFAISLLIMIPGLIALFLWGLQLSIDFTGGSRMEVQIPKGTANVSNTVIESTIEKQKTDVVSIQKTGNNSFIVRMKPIDQKKHQLLLTELKKVYPSIKEKSFETVGPTIGVETTWNAVKAVAVAIALIVLYMAWSFRNVPKPASSWRFGVCTIAALVHDVIVVVGIFAILGHFYHVEIDSLFITAVLTVIGFSVHDTIVVFDRIRENLRKSGNLAFPIVVNESITQTLNRSLNTSLTTLLVLFTLFLFGGESIRWFVVALLIGILSGTYSSIFNAAPLLVVWEEWSRKRNK
jgi:preprotein translocase subunit SecF